MNMEKRQELHNKAVDLLLKKEAIVMLVEQIPGNLLTRRRITIFPNPKEECTYSWYIEHWDFDLNDMVSDFKSVITATTLDVVNSFFSLFNILGVKPLFRVEE